MAAVADGRGMPPISPTVARRALLRGRPARGSGGVRELGAAGGEELAFGAVAGQEEGFVVGKAGLLVPVEAAEVFGPGGGQVVVARQLRFGREGVQGSQAGGGAVGFADGDGAVERDDRGRPD